MTAAALTTKPLRTVRLYGELGEKYGKEFQMYVSSVGEALRLLAANFKDFRQHLVDSDTRLAGYEVWSGDYNLGTKDEDFSKHSDADIKIIPIIQGASATGRIIAGVVLIVIGAVLAYTGVGASAAPYFFYAGIGLIAGGIAEKLSPKTKVNSTESNDVASADSYIFNGASNSTRQGNPVPIGYGEMIIGSNVISASIVAEDYPI